MNTARTLTPSPDAPVYSPAVIEASLDGLRAKINADALSAAITKRAADIACLSLMSDFRDLLERAHEAARRSDHEPDTEVARAIEDAMCAQLAPLERFIGRLAKRSVEAEIGGAS
jgi:hypothetical protein